MSTLVESIISPKSIHSRSSSYGRIATDEDTERAALEGGERTSPFRITVNVDDRFCIDDGDESDDGEDGNNDINSDSNRGRSRHTTRQTRRHLPELPFLLPSEHIPNPPANYICPLTLQLMEDPVQDSCGHTFERRAIMEWLDRSSGNSGNDNSNSGSGSIHRRAAVCPISRKPLTPLSCSGIPVEHNSNNNNIINTNTNDSHSCNDRVLKRNEGLQNRIQEWKLHYPLYQGVDAGYAEHQRETMLTHNTIRITNTNTSNNNNNNILYASIECPYGDGETIDDCDSSRHTSESGRSNQQQQHHRLSRFELLLLPQERDVRKILNDRSREEQQRLIRWHRWRLLVSIVLTILILVGVLYTVLRRGRVE